MLTVVPAVMPLGATVNRLLYTLLLLHSQGNASLEEGHMSTVGTQYNGTHLMTADGA